MDKNTKITLAELIKRKEQVLEAKKNVKRARVYVKSLGGEIIIKAPTKSLATEAAEMENDGDAHLVYECVAEPDLHSKELQDAYGCTYPEEIVEKLFDDGFGVGNLGKAVDNGDVIGVAGQDAQGVFDASRHAGVGRDQDLSSHCREILLSQR